MTWTKLDENFPQHPKILAAGPVAELLHIHALIYCNRLLTDGLVPANAVRHLIHVPERRPVEKLVELGIWEKVDGGYQIHDFLEYQPSRAKVLAQRKQKSSAGQAGGLARARGSASASLQAKSKPVPYPFRSVGSLDPVPRDNALREGTVPKGTNGQALTPVSDSLAAIRARIHARAES